MSADTYDLKAPISGILVPIEQVPDPIFAQKMVGDGVSIDPTDGVLHAPCDGVVAHLHPAHHAVTLALENGVELLLHIGVDTVHLKGEGFEAKVKQGEKVRAGDPLIAFDLDRVATQAKSLLTQMVVTDRSRIASLRVEKSGRTSAGENTVMSLTFSGGGAQRDPDGPVLTSEAVLLPNPTGLHARPAAVLAHFAKRFRCDIKLQCGDARANAKSVTGIMKLNTCHGDKVVVIASGPDAREALEVLIPHLKMGLGDEGCLPAAASASRVPPESEAPAPRLKSNDPHELLGVSASPGLAVGQVFQIRHPDLSVREEGGEPDGERDRLRAAIASAQCRLQALQNRLQREKQASKAAIFAAHEELLDDPELLDLAQSAIDQGRSAPFAWKQAYTFHAAEMAALKNERLAARAMDVRDVGERVLTLLLGMETAPAAYPENAILIAEDLTPSDTAEWDPQHVRGFATVRGGATSHVAILARGLGIPALAGMDPHALEIPSGTDVILNGTRGRLRLHPTPDQIARLLEAQRLLRNQREDDLAHAQEPAVTRDGHAVEVAANIGGESEAARVVAAGGDGVGLLRSEFLFMNRLSAPSEDEQFSLYKAMAERLGPQKRLIIRTLDVGGDKPLAYLPIPKEDNPFLGERGLRVGLNRPGILRAQIRAILRASEYGRLHILFPMVATHDEWREAQSILEEERGRLGVPPIPVGIMIEIPAAAVLADIFAREVDFFSVGTNDLTQYTLAMDRGHPKFGSKMDALNPGVLRLMKIAVDAAHANGKWTGVCGGLAGDPQAVPILLGLGVDELSVSLPALARVKALIRELSLVECRDLAGRALQCSSAGAVRALVAEIGAEDVDF